MGEPSDSEIDEVALNVLLAEGLDFPTAFEASRMPAVDPPSQDEQPLRAKGVIVAIEIFAVALAMILAVLVWVAL